MSIGQGTKLGPYEVQDFIGQGAMGVVYRAYHAQLERTGAIKVMQAITPDPDTVARFRHEAQAIAKLRHPNIVDVYDFGEYQGTPYMIVEYIPGGSLAGTMAHGAPDQATALKYLRGIAAGLDYAHGHGVVHRDIKPANVLLTNEGTPVLADFGLAKLLQGSSLKSMTGVTTGTPAYMAPEQVTGHQVGPAADRYSLATIAYEMLTGVIPFDGEGLMELLYAQVHRLPTPPSARVASLGTEVDAVLMKGLAKDPASRWASATEFVDALESALSAPPAEVLAKTMVMAPPVASTRRLTKRGAPPPPPAETVLFDPETVAVAYPSPPPPAAPARRSRRRQVIALAAVLILLLIMGVCAVITTQAITLNVNPNLTVPGGVVKVTATHLPANQAAEVELLS
ncbi:MAG: serine/threonine protein kinase, partial [Chloroflexi bacterium]